MPTVEERTTVPAAYRAAAAPRMRPSTASSCTTSCSMPRSASTPMKRASPSARASRSISTSKPADAAIDDQIDRVLDYDTIIAIIKTILAEGHINLVETLADEIATRCLDASPRGLGEGQDREARQGAWRRRRRDRAPPRADLMHDPSSPADFRPARPRAPTRPRRGEARRQRGAFAPSSPAGSMSSPRARVPIVVVPGGGALADEVRAAQTSARHRRRRRASHGAACHGPARLGHRRLAPLASRSATPRTPCGKPCAGARCGVGALQPRRRSRRHSAILDGDLRQSGALARRGGLAPSAATSSNRSSGSAPLAAPSSSPATAWSMKPFRPCSGTQACPSSSLAAATSLRLPRASRRQATPLAAQPSTNANALSTSPSPRSCQHGRW